MSEYVNEKLPYERSFAYHIEVELKENLNKYWNWEKNNELGINPYELSKCSGKKVWIYCQEHDYHNYDKEGNKVGYMCRVADFYSRKGRCHYCNSKKVHYKDSFAQWGIDTFGEDFLEKYWSSKNTLNPWELSKGSNKKVWIYCQEHDYHNYDRNGDKIGYEIICKFFYQGSKCGFCCSKKIHYKDSLAYKYPQIAEMIAIEKNGITFEDCFNISCGSDRKYYVKCLDCKEISSKKIILNNIRRQGFSCAYCSDGISLPEKFMANILKQLNIDFQTQLNKSTFNWCKDYRYDFYILSMNMIIEIHGEQHYTEKHTNNNWVRTLEEEQANDKYKKHLAKKNSIKRYYSIDCRYSELEYMKQNIIKTLSHLFDLSEMDWELAWVESQKSKCVEAWDLYNNITQDIVEISKMLKLSAMTILRYLKQGEKCGKCDYTKEQSIKLGAIKRSAKNNVMSSKVICIETRKIFDTITQAGKSIEVSRKAITNAIKRKGKSGGYRWKYLKVDHTKTLRGKDISKLHSKNNKKVA